MIVRAALLGLILWLAGTAAFRFAGPAFFSPDPGGHLMLFIATPIALVASAWLSMRLLRVRPGDEAEAAIGLALPGMALDAFAALNFSTVFPQLDPTLDTTFAALVLVAYGAVIFAGLLFTRLQPEDERL
jgi:Family of unknown function (DUF5367)